jgi:hypothetical protein
VSTIGFVTTGHRGGQGGLWGSDGGNRLVSTVGFVTVSHRGGRGALGGLAEGDGAMGRHLSRYWGCGSKAH